MLAAPANARPMIDLALAKRGLQRRIAMRVPHFISMPLMVLASDMICTLPRLLGLRLHTLAVNAGKLCKGSPNASRLRGCT